MISTTTIASLLLCINTSIFGISECLENQAHGYDIGLNHPMRVDKPERQSPIDILDMPVFEINTEREITSKTEYVKGSLTIYGVDEAITLTNAPLRMRGRGNGSWIVSEKKSYRIKFDKKTNLLGQGKGKAKSWTLLAIHNDKSLLRNEAAFYFASHLENIPFVSSSSFVELYLNGEYRGVYEVCDQIQVHKARINIDETGAESNIAFLVELDQIANDDVIEISSGDKFEIKSNYSDESQKKYIQQYMDNSFRSILTADKVAVEKWIDIPSAVDCYIVEEFMKNLDVGWGSFYFTKPKDGKLYFGPVWDFNLTAGNAEDSIQPSVLTSSFRSYKYTYVGNGSFWYKQQNLWFYALRQCPWFNEMVRERWKQVRPFAE